MTRALSLVVVSALVLAAAASGRSAKEGELVLVRPSGAAGPLVAYDGGSGAVRFRLPAGRLTADGSRFVAAAPAGDAAALRTYSPASGALLASFSVPDGLPLAAVSPTGRFAVLGRRGSTGRPSSFVVVDAASGAVVHRATLPGDFEVEAVDTAGRRLFLIEHAAGRRYVIRLYDVGKAELEQDPLVSKGSGPVMAGYAWDAVGSPNGRWLLTLYLSTARNVAFVHTLDLIARVAVCVNLPSQVRGIGPLSRYVLTLAPGGSTLYASNPALGIVAELGLRERQVISTARFRPVRGAARGPAAISADGRRLAFATGRTVFVYDTWLRRVGPVQDAGGTVAGLAFSPSGLVRVIRRDGTLVRIATA